MSLLDALEDVYSVYTIVNSFHEGRMNHFVPETRVGVFRNKDNAISLARKLSETTDSQYGFMVCGKHDEVVMLTRRGQTIAYEYQFGNSNVSRNYLSRGYMSVLLNTDNNIPFAKSLHNRNELMWSGDVKNII